MPLSFAPESPYNANSVEYGYCTVYHGLGRYRGYSTVVICHAGTPMLPLGQAYYPDQDEGVGDGTTDY
jgi:hypothetical protein